MSKRFFVVLGIISSIVLDACRSQKTPVGKVAVWPELKYNNEFEFVSKAELDNRSLKEISGIAEGRINKVLYVHEDSFCPNKVYLLGFDGKYKGFLKLKGRRNWDWEDLTIGGGPEEGKSYLYVGDIGDNYKIMNAAIVYRFEEPLLADTTLIKKNIYKPDRLRLQYPDGRHNAETLLLDPQTKDLYIISKGKTAGIYKAAFPQDLSTSNKMEYLGTLPIEQATSGCITSDGKEIIIKDYHRIYYWKRSEGKSIAETLLTPPQLLPYQPEPQGEAVCFNKNNSGYYTISEIENRPGLISTLYFYKRKQ